MSDVNVPAGTTITFHIWIPSGSMITEIKPYLQDYNWAWSNTSFVNLTTNAWNTLTLPVPSSYITPVKRLGLQIVTSAAWSATCYIDAISWPPAPPAAPTGLSATMVSSSQINLSWSASTGATSYNVKRATVSGGPYTTVQTGVTGTTFSNTGLSAGTTYYYVVSAINAGGEGANSAQASATTQVAPPAAPAGLNASAVSTSQINLSWNASSGATSYNVKRATVSGGPYTMVQTGVTGTTFNNTGLSAGTTYYYVVSAVNAGGEGANSTQASATTAANLGPLPSGWSGGDLGAVAASGSSGYTNGVYTINGSGADIWGTADEFYFVRQQITGDCDIRARVASLGNTNGSAKAGVMIRESLNANSTHAMVNVTPSVGAEFIRRTTTGGASTATGNAGITAPQWVRLVRSGNTFTAYRSSDGATWTTIGSDTITMGATVYAGLVVTSHNDGVLATATVDSVSVTALPSPWQTGDIGAVAATGSVTQTNGTFTVVGSGADIWDTADEFRYVYQTASGDCELVARVTAVGNTNIWAKAGVMIRESLNANSSHAMVVVTSGSGVSFQRRASTGGTSSDTNNSGLSAPYWVRIVRSGSTFTGYRSTDGTNWTTIGSQTITMSSTVTIGLVVTSHADGTLCTAKLDNVTATP